MSQTPAEILSCLKEYKVPTTGYRRGEDGEIEAHIFDRDLPEGWADSPAEVDGVSPPTEREAAVTEPLSASYEARPFNVLRAELKRRTGKGPAVGTSKAGVVAILTDLDDDDVTAADDAAFAARRSAEEQG